MDLVQRQREAAHRQYCESMFNLIIQQLDDIDCCEGYTIPESDYPKFWKAQALARDVIEAKKRMQETKRS